MFIYRMAYRHENGEVEGFAGCGFTEEAAEKDAHRKAGVKCEGIGKPFSLARCINTKAGLTGEEMATVRADWEISARSSTL